MTSFACDGWNLIEDYDGAGNELARYIHGPQSDEMLAKISPTGAVYYTQDGNHYHVTGWPVRECKKSCFRVNCY